MSGVNSESQGRRDKLCAATRDRKYVVSYEQLMGQFFPSFPNWDKKEFPNIFLPPPDLTNESSIYEWITTRLNETDYFKGYTFVATPYKSDRNDDSEQMFNCGMYKNEFLPKPGQKRDGKESRRVNWGRLDLSIHAKMPVSERDPLDESTPNYEPTATSPLLILGQILLDAELVFKYQQRAFHYTIVFFSDCARIIRFDRSGMVATHRLKYADDGHKITEFLIRYAHCGDSDKGYDTTAHRIEPETALFQAVQLYANDQVEENEKKVAAGLTPDHAAQRFYDSLTHGWPMWKLQVKDECTNKVFSYAVGKPDFQVQGVAGRGTRGYVALPLSEDGSEPAGPFVYLKDAWRIVHSRFQKEGDVLKTLNEKKVQFVPTLVCHGDVSNQEAQTYTQWTACFPDETQHPCPLKNHRHYRLVVAEIGKPLECFKNGLELMIAILSCIVAHEQACFAGYIHRDISAGNILLVWYEEKRRYFGMLNDWELAGEYPYSENPEAQSQSDRIGTWQYQSAHALLNQARIVDIADDLESFLHVIVEYGVRFLPHNCEDEAVGRFLFDYFDDCTEGVDGEVRCGPTKYYAMLAGEIDLALLRNRCGIAVKFNITQTLQFFASHSGEVPVCHPIDKILTTLFAWFKEYYHRPRGSRKRATATSSSHVLERKASNAEGEPLPVIHKGATEKPKTTEKPATPSLVESHAATKGLIAKVITSFQWPDDDKGNDKLLKILNKGVPKKSAAAAIRQSSVPAISKKRSLQSMDMPTSKKAKHDS